MEYQCDTGEARTGSIEGRAEDCSTELTLEVLDDGETVDERTFEPTDGQWAVGFGEGPGQIRTIPSQGDKRVQVRGPDDEVHVEGTLDVSHYLDSPDLDVWRPQFEPRTVSVSEPVTVSFRIATFGGGTSFTASLLVDGETVDNREGTVDGGADCQDASGPEYEFTRAFDEPGDTVGCKCVKIFDTPGCRIPSKCYSRQYEYELAGRIIVDGHSGAGDSKSIGTVTVTE
ncbi:MAG: hypothetical protein V5A55_13495 [Halovenus sp.]